MYCSSFYNYQKVADERLGTSRNNVRTLAESIRVLQTDIKDFSTYICINNEIHNLLTAHDPDILNINAKLWLEEAPMQIVQDMIALKGHIKTIAIYPTNGVRPYLRGMDGSVYLPDIEQVKKPMFIKKQSAVKAAWCGNRFQRTAGRFIFPAGMTRSCCAERFLIWHRKNTGLYCHRIQSGKTGRAVRKYFGKGKGECDDPGSQWR